MSQTLATDARTTYSVSELNHAVGELLTHSFPLLWVEGEISNLAQPRSGHWYFSLKDQQAQVRCAMFRNKNRLLRFTPENGMQILVRAKVSLYPTRGDYQMLVEHMEDAGAGALQRAFEQLKARLSAEGLFDAALKQPLPAIPQRIGVITSATGAALHDVLSVLRRRYPMGRVLLYPVPVQGTAAAPAICRALATAGIRAECDVLLLVRGGGSLEDLWAFNEEAVARAIRACPLPVVAGIGHEVDTSIADFAADVRAPTPSAAAELVCPDQDVWHTQLQQLKRRLQQQLSHHLVQAEQRLAQTHARLSRLHPERRLQDHSQRLDGLEQRLYRTLRWSHQQRTSHWQNLYTRLQACGPTADIANHYNNLQYLWVRLTTAMNRRVGQADARWRLASRGLHAVSPLQTLARGYAIASSTHGQVITSATDVKPGDSLQVTLHTGRLDCEVTRAHSQSGDSLP